MKKENIKISSFVFITFSLSAFVMVSFLYLFLSYKFHYLNSEKKVYAIEEIYLNKNYNNNDPYITTAGGIKNIINGPIISNYDPYLGSFDAPVKIIVYSDFTCQYCAKQEETIKNILKKYEGKLRFIWKDYPETDIDSLSFKASLAARCAQNQDKFWEFHDALYSNKISGEDDIYEIASSINIDYNLFETCFKEMETMPLIVNNIEEANAIGVIGVPDVYVNDKEFIGNISENDFSLIIDSMLKNE